MKAKEELMPIITEAVLSGYRLIGKSFKRQKKWKRRLIFSFIDSATVYKNEEVLGAILKDIFADPTFKIQRKDLFITSKLCK
jgi:hypothetical protein